MTFADWMKAVDEAVWKIAGLSVHDLEDCCFADWFEDHVNPATAARRAIRRSGGAF